MPFSKSEAETGPDVCRSMAHATLDAFIDVLAHANTIGGPFSIEVIREHAAQFKQGRHSNAYIPRFDECQSIRDQEIWDKTRRQPFDRLMVMRFSHLFPPEGGLTNDHDFVSRRVLPGLFMALEKMAGEEQFDACRLACKSALTDEENRQGGRMRWSDFYLNESANELVDDLLMSMLPHFANLHKRAIWMGDMINHELLRFDDYAFECPTAQTWTLDHHGTLSLLRALYSRFQVKMNMQSGRTALLERYGAANVHNLHGLLKDLQAAQ